MKKGVIHRTLGEWSGSLALRIPSVIASLMKFTKGAKVKLTIRGNKLIIEQINLQKGGKNGTKIIKKNNSYTLFNYITTFTIIICFLTVNLYYAHGSHISKPLPKINENTLNKFIDEDKTSNIKKSDLYDELIKHDVNPNLMFEPLKKLILKNAKPGTKIYEYSQTIAEDIISIYSLDKLKEMNEDELYSVVDDYIRKIDLNSELCAGLLKDSAPYIAVIAPLLFLLSAGTLTGAIATAIITIVIIDIVQSIKEKYKKEEPIIIRTERELPGVKSENIYETKAKYKGENRRRWYIGTTEFHGEGCTFYCELRYEHNCEENQCKKKYYDKKVRHAENKILRTRGKFFYIEIDGPSVDFYGLWEWYQTQVRRKVSGYCRHSVNCLELSSFTAEAFSDYRPCFRNKEKTKNDIFSKAVENSEDGLVFCPGLYKLDGSVNQKCRCYSEDGNHIPLNFNDYGSRWEIGHKPYHEYIEEYKKYLNCEDGYRTWSNFIDQCNKSEHYEVQCITCNRSHELEECRF